ncbi:MAG TPA: DUF4337 domain-containing protein [Rhodocyclaceae bacterium]|nr:DUF4337 domain-containing protein [Rhodocyclaceae bacterium]
MSGHGFHVHGPHDHAVEHAGHSGDNFASKIAVMTAVLSTIGALFSYEGGATQNDALLHKNMAAIKKTEASNQWNYYQAKSNKQNLAELAVALNDGENRARYQQEVERYKAEKTDIKKEAEKLEDEVKEFNKKSDESMHLHHRWAQAMTAIQVAISMAAITLLSRKKWLNYVTYTAAGAGGILAAMALAHI